MRFAIISHADEIAVGRQPLAAANNPLAIPPSPPALKHEILVSFSFQLMLLHYKADVNAPDNDGNTPLHLCTANGHEKVKKGR